MPAFSIQIGLTALKARSRIGAAEQTIDRVVTPPSTGCHDVRFLDCQADHLTA